MKIRLLALSIVLTLSPVVLFAGIDLDKLVIQSSQQKTPAGVVTKMEGGSPRTEPSKTPATVHFSVKSQQDPIAIFTAGGYLTFSYRFYFLNTVGINTLQVDLPVIRKTLQDLGLNETAMQQYDQFTQCLLSLPFGTPWEQWTAEQQKSWNETGCPGWRELMFSQIAPQLSGNSEAYFFFWLGVDSARLGGSIPQYIKDGKTLSDVSEDLKSAITGFGFAATDQYANTLSTEVVSAVNRISRFKAKMEVNGIQSITIDDVNEMQREASSIIVAASKNTLLK